MTVILVKVVFQIKWNKYQGKSQRMVLKQVQTEPTQVLFVLLVTSKLENLFCLKACIPYLQPFTFYLFFSRDDINLVKQLVKKFGSLTFSTNVGSNTSHVVTGEGKRTLNLLKGLLQGCWIVSKVCWQAFSELKLWIGYLLTFCRTGFLPHLKMDLGSRRNLMKW